MSHFLVTVFHSPNGRNVEDLLAPYDESIEMPRYIRYTKAQAIENQRQDYINYLNSPLYKKYLSDPEKYKSECRNDAHIKYLESFPEKLKYTDEQLYEEYAKFWEEDCIDEEGNLWSTYNPNSKWDWYSIGGRWNGVLKTKDGKNTNEALISEVDWDKSIPFAYITPKGLWKEKGEMLWFGMTANEISQEEWNKQFLSFVDSLPKNTIATIVDCHI